MRKRVTVTNLLEDVYFTFQKVCSIAGGTVKYEETEIIIELEGNTLVFTGRMEKSIYDEVQEFLSNAEKTVQDDEMIIDLRKLAYLNSSGLRLFASLFIESKKKFQLFLSKEYAWQEVGIVPLTRIRPNLITIMT